MSVQFELVTEMILAVKEVCVCLHSQVTDAYSEFDAGRVIRVLQAFISRDLSSFYFSIIKDRFGVCCVCVLLMSLFCLKYLNLRHIFKSGCTVIQRTLWAEDRVRLF